MVVRLQKFMAEAGIASRRECEKIIESGVVSVNGKTALLGTKVDPETDEICVNGDKINLESKKYYIMLNKPRAVLSSSKDNRGRICVVDLVQSDIKARLFPVGRLDYNTEGLIFLTNDGDFSNHITHPSNKISKTYIARVKGGMLKKDELNALRRGVNLDDGNTKPAFVEVLEIYPDMTTLIKITISEGRNRQIRRMCEAVGHPVCDLMRTEINGIKLGNLPYGKWRHLTQAEIKSLTK